MTVQEFKPKLDRYRRALAEWDQKASVRQLPRRFVNPAERKLPFTKQLVPAALHQTTIALGPDAVYQVLGRRLFTYLQFTDVLETEAVVPASLLIARDLTGFSLPAGMAFNGRRIATDEMYHAQCAADLTDQMSIATGVSLPARTNPMFLEQLNFFKANVSSELAPLVLVFFSIVSETLITSILKDVPNDEQVVTAVRDVIRDHHRDEARHHMYFSDVLGVLWPQLSPRQKDIIGPLIPLFIKAFLEPDRATIATWFEGLDLSAAQVEEIIEESYSSENVANTLSLSARPAMFRLKDVGVLEHSASQEAFEQHGLLPAK